MYKSIKQTLFKIHQSCTLYILRLSKSTFVSNVEIQRLSKRVYQDNIHRLSLHITRKQKEVVISTWVSQCRLLPRTSIENQRFGSTYPRFTCSLVQEAYDSVDQIVLSRQNNCLRPLIRHYKLLQRTDSKGPEQSKSQPSFR